MVGDYPFVNYVLSDENMPVEARLEAYTPFIPLATEDSSKPAAVLKYTICNKTDKALTVSVVGSMPNMSCYKGQNMWDKAFFDGKSKNNYVDRGNYRGLQLMPAEKDETDISYFESALVTTEREGVSCLDYWHEGSWVDGLQDFWNDFMEDGNLTSGRMLLGQRDTMRQSDIPMGSLCVKKVIPANESADFTFLFAWYCPNRVRSWNQRQKVTEQHPIIRNYYTKFGSPLVMLDDLVPRLSDLEEKSRKFTKALRTGNIPEYVIDAISSTITVIRSNTCFRVEDGTFFAWEGNFDKDGCCEGNCTHVWGYTQMLAFLFPELERSMRRTEFLHETDPDGRMYFRARSSLGDSKHDWPPTADGQLDTITRLYRDWKLCGDDNFLREMWPNAKRALDYACVRWDCDGDGVLDGEQHNTYDIEFFGQTSMINTIFFAALKCGKEICSYLGDGESAEHYEQMAQKGAEKLEALTFNGEYYIQKIDDVNKHKYQYGTGCLADQLLGQQLAHVNHLGYVLDEKHVKSAVKAIYENNFKEDFSDIVNLQRTYVLNDDAGLLLCTWPNGGRPIIPFVYSDEVWIGIEYQVASHLIYEGYVEEGLRIVKAVRERHDGIEIRGMK